MRAAERARAVLAVVWFVAASSLAWLRARLGAARQMWQRIPGRATPRMRRGRLVEFLDPHGRDRAATSPQRTAAAAAGIVSSVGLVGLVEQYGLGGVLYATFLEVIGGIQSLGESITAPFEAFGSGIARLISAVIPVRIVNAAADFTAFSITRGEWAIFGPFTFAVGVAATISGLWVFLEIVSRAQIGLFGNVLSRLRNN